MISTQEWLALHKGLFNTLMDMQTLNTFVGFQNHVLIPKK